MFQFEKIEDNKIVKKVRQRVLALAENSNIDFNREVDLRHLIVKDCKNEIVGIGSRQCSIYNTETEALEGFFVCMESFIKADLVQYYAFCKIQSEEFEVFVRCGKDEVHNISQKEQMIAQCKVTKSKYIYSDVPFPLEWEIVINDKVFARVVRPDDPMCDILTFQTEEFGNLSFSLKNKNNIVKSLLKVFSSSPCNDNLIIPENWPRSLSVSQLKILFICVMIFRTQYMPLEFAK